MVQPCITITRFNPFPGQPPVIGLSFTYSPHTVQTLKLILRQVRPAGSRPVGGWLPEYKKWFVEMGAWPRVRQRLREAGYVLRGDVEEGPADGSAGGAAAEEPVPGRSLVDVHNLVSRWYRRLSLRYHPDRGGTDEQMRVVNAAREELEEILRG